MKTPFEILQKPVITEKSTAGQAMANPQYTFKVCKDANKREVKSAIEIAFPGVRVKSVNSLNVKGKRKRLRLQVGKRPDWKKVIVTLQKGDVIDFY